MPRPRRTAPMQRTAMPSIAGIGRQVADRRLALGLTQQALADLAGVSRSSVQTIEYGGATVKIGAVAEIAAALGLDLAVVPKGEIDGRRD